MNAHTSQRHSVEFLTEVMQRPAMAAILKETRQALRENPDACLVIGTNSMVQVRVGEGKRSWVSVRALMWMQANYLHQSGYPEPPWFGAATCGTTGCVNPAHQQARANSEPRIKVVHAKPV